MKKRSILFVTVMVFSLAKLHAQTDAERIKALEEKVDLLTKQVQAQQTQVQQADTTIAIITKEEKKSMDEKWEEIKSRIPFKISGSADVYVQTNFAGKHTNSVLNEAFPNKANSFELGMINLMMSKEIKKVGFMADIGFGPRAEAANNTLYSNTILAIKQLYMTYAPTDWVKFTLGNFSTYFGYELIEPQNNFHYSTSLAFQNGPFYHTGFKANFTKKNWNVLLGFFDDTDTKSDDDRNKYVGAQVGYTGSKVSTYLNFIGGNEPDTLFQRRYKFALGSTTSATLGKNGKGTLALDLAYYRWLLKVNKKDDTKSNAQFASVYLYGKYAITEKAAIGARMGYLNNNDLVAPYVAGAAKHFADFTLTSTYTIGGMLRLVPEFRVDYANEKVFINNKGEASNLQYRLLLAAIVTF